MNDDELRAWQERTRATRRVHTGDDLTPLSDSLNVVAGGLLGKLESQPRKLRPTRQRSADRPEVAVCPTCQEEMAYALKVAGNATLPGDLARFGLPIWERGECFCERTERVATEERWRTARIEAEERERAMRIKRNWEESGIEGSRLRKMTLDSFDSTLSESAQAAFSAMSSWSSTFLRGDGSRGFALSGPVGCGKTHLAIGVGQRILSEGGKVLFTTMGELLDSMRADFDRKTTGATMTRASGADVLILDDFGAERIATGERGDWVREQVFTLFDRRYRYERPVVVTTNLDIDAIAERIGGDHGARIVSRLAALADWYIVDGPDGRLA